MTKSTNKSNKLLFQPSFLLKNRHIQTLYASFFRKEIPLNYHIEEFTLSDGDFLDIYYTKELLPQDTQAIAVIFHGLAGSYKSPYVQGLSWELQKHGIAPVVMHYRSTSGRDNRFPQTYHSGKTDDALEFLHNIKKHYPDKKLFCVGYSLGANMLLKLLGELKEKSFIDAAAAVSAPMDLALCADVMNRGFARIYQEHLLKELRSSLEKKYEKHDMQKLIGIKKEDIKKLKSFWEFDEVYTAKINGFASAKDYYEKCSAKNFVDKIATPTLLLHAKDDPFMSPAVIPTQEEVSSSVEREVYEHGGHVGFISGKLTQPLYWLDKRITEYLLNSLSYNQLQKHS
jgi:predicted alpha/beta-fold hydrolase